MDEIKAAYHELRAEYLEISLQEYLSFDERVALESPALIKKVALFSELSKKTFSNKEYLNFNPKKSENQNLIKAYQKARNSSPLLFIEQYYDASKEYPLRISEAEPTQIGEQGEIVKMPEESELE